MNSRVYFLAPAIIKTIIFKILCLSKLPITERKGNGKSVQFS